MASPASLPPAGIPNDDALDILRRIEPALTAIAGEQRRQADLLTQQAGLLAQQAALLAKLDERQRMQGEALARIDGKLEAAATKEDVAEIRGQLKYMPTVWTIAAIIIALFGASFLLIRFATGR